MFDKLRLLLDNFSLLHDNEKSLPVKIELLFVNDRNEHVTQLAKK